MKMIRYADDFVILVHGTRDDARALRAEVGRVLAPMGLRLSADKTRLTHIEEGFEFLGWRIQRRKKKGTRGTTRVYTYPSKKSLASIIDRIRILTRRTAHRTLADLLRRPGPDGSEAGAPISSTGSPSARSATSTTSPSGEYSAGSTSATPA